VPFFSAPFPTKKFACAMLPNSIPLSDTENTSIHSARDITPKDHGFQDGTMDLMDWSVTSNPSSGYFSDI
jgi:hypothetical protein